MQHKTNSAQWTRGAATFQKSGMSILSLPLPSFPLPGSLPLEASYRVWGSAQPRLQMVSLQSDVKNGPKINKQLKTT